MLKLIGKYYSHLCFGLASLMVGTYIFFHPNYLDNPEVTLPPPPGFAEHGVFGAADDWWLAGLLVVDGIVLLSGVLLDISLLILNKKGDNKQCSFILRLIQMVL